MISSAGAEFRYRFGGLRISSSLRLPGLLTALDSVEPHGAADISISVSATPPPAGVLVAQWRGRYGLSLEALGDDTWLIRQAGGQGVTVANGGRSLQCHTPSAGLTSDFADIIVRRILPRIAVLHGRLVIHAATVGHGSGATLLLGSSGAGKSTLTAALAVQAGWQVYADDISILDATSRPLVFAALCGVSIRQEAVPGLALSARVDVTAPRADDKIWFAPASVAPPAQPLERVFLLSTSESGSAIACTPLSGAHVLVKLSSQLVVFNPRDARRVGMLIDQLTRLITTVPVYGLSYPRHFTALPDVIATLERQPSGGIATPSAD